MRRFVRWLALAFAALVLAAGLWSWLSASRKEQDAGGVSSAALGLVLLESEQGVYVLAVSDKSPAWYAGLEPGDVILASGETQLSIPSALDALLETADSALPLTIRREGTEQMLLLPVR